METILHSGPSLFANRSFFLKPWTVTFFFDKGLTLNVLMRVTFPNLGL